LLDAARANRISAPADSDTRAHGGARHSCGPNRLLRVQDDYVAVRCRERSYLKEQPLGELEGHLDARMFVRIHRRYILNLSRLAKIELGITENRIAFLRDGTQLPISRTGHARLKELL
jgi:two-component system, LytTR family, response regulator